MLPGHRARHSSDVGHWVWYRVGYGDGYTGWVYRGVLPSHRARRSPTSEAGPGSLREAGVGGLGAGCVSHVVFGGGDGPSTHPAGPVAYGLPGTGTLQIAASGPIRARFSLISCKVSQNPEVSPEKCEKACHSPGFQNGLRKSALEILGFPYSAAFSHKELMARFDAYSDFSVKTTKCRSDVHTCTRTRRGRTYPQRSVQQAAPTDLFLMCSARETA